jgi:hypothetical protein
MGTLILIYHFSGGGSKDSIPNKPGGGSRVLVLHPEAHSGNSLLSLAVMVHNSIELFQYSIGQMMVEKRVTILDEGNCGHRLWFDLLGELVWARQGVQEQLWVFGRVDYPTTARFRVFLDYSYQALICAHEYCIT